MLITGHHRLIVMYAHQQETNRASGLEMVVQGTLGDFQPTCPICLLLMCIHHTILSINTFSTVCMYMINKDIPVKLTNSSCKSAFLILYLINHHKYWKFTDTGWGSCCLTFGDSTVCLQPGTADVQHHLRELLFTTFIHT